MCFAFIILSTAAQHARAELPPSAYAEMQKAASEVVTIEVRDVQTTRTRLEGVTQIDVLARVRIYAVERSKSHLEKGDIVFISYRHEKQDTPFAGPSQVPILKIGQRLPAFLDKVEKKRAEYRPAAGGYSFETVKQPELKAPEAKEKKEEKEEKKS